MIKDDGAPADQSAFQGKSITELFQPAVGCSTEADDVSKVSEGSSTEDQSEFVQVELNDNNEGHLEPEDVFEPLPKLVPDFWEPSSEEESTQKLSDRLKILTNHVVKEAQRPFKEMFGDMKSDSGVTSLKGKSNHTTDEDHQNSVNSTESLKGFIKGVQKKLWKQTQTESTQTCVESHSKTSADLGEHDCTSMNKQLKQKATLELLKVAFKTNMILNSLFYYFKKVVESEGSFSESLSDNSQDCEFFKGDGPSKADCKISVDSFFFRTQRSAILWGSKSNCDTKDVIVRSSEENLPVDIKTCTERSSSAEDSRSQVEVLSKSQATLSMLMKGSHSWTKFDAGIQDDLQEGGEETNYNLYMTGYDSEPQYLSRLLTGRIEQHDNLLDSMMGNGPRVKKVLDRGSFSEGNCYQPKVTRKFHSEHSSLMLEQSEVWKEDSEQVLETRLSCECDSKTDHEDVQSEGNVQKDSVISSLVDVSEEFDLPSEQSGHSQQSLLDLVFGLNRTCAKPSLLPLPDCQQDLITLSTPGSSTERLPHKRKDAISQTALSSKHLEQEMNLLHKAFLDQLAHFSVQLVNSCKTFGHSWQTSFLAELVEHFRSACNIISDIIGDSHSVAQPSSERLDELQNISNKISVCLAKLRAHPHSFIGDCTDHDISTLLSSPPGQEAPSLVNTWV
ncbi:hypothetical protein GE061_006132 [Apolygus lucorum]|uniref:Uncharacterized protein n=1 Tax=Apolygus lucorum TaxID=248454 RepID=A0A6A4IRK4_APOLU|nr:hypothetical protein GE061_006132 [Apolygus lucorum]